MKTIDEMAAGKAWVCDTEPWAEPVEGRVLLDALAGTMRRFLVLPKWAPEALALWIVHTYGFGLRDVTAYLGIESPEKRCGKTTLLGLLNKLVNRPIAAANISSPAFFRVIEEARPTLLIDEADTFLSGNDELRGILNSGYTRNTAYVVRVGASDLACVQGQPGEAPARGKAAGAASRLARYSCWCPKVMAAIGGLPETLADRCIIIRMQRKTAREACERLRDLDGTEAATLRRQCARFVADQAEAIAQWKPQIPADLNDRAGDIWEPLLVLAELAGEEWAARGRDAAIGLTRESEDQNPIGALLMDILIQFVATKSPRLFSRMLVEGLNAAEDRPWQQMRNGKEITELWLAQQLAPYGIRPRTVRLEHATAKGYAEDDFSEIFRRYIPRSELEDLRMRRAGSAPEDESGAESL
jgi:hypothetical protein